MHEVDGSASELGFLVKVSALLHEVGNICNVNSNLVDEVRDLVNRKGVVEVLGS